MYYKLREIISATYIHFQVSYSPFIIISILKVYFQVEILHTQQYTYLQYIAFLYLYTYTCVIITQIRYRTFSASQKAYLCPIPVNIPSLPSYSVSKPFASFEDCVVLPLLCRSSVYNLVMSPLMDVLYSTFCYCHHAVHRLL